MSGRVFLERKGRRESIIILIIMIIIALVIVSFLSGLWNFDTGSKALTDEEMQDSLDYVNPVSVYVQQSNKISYDFFNVLDRASNMTREELDSELLAIIEDSRVVLGNSKELVPPEVFKVANGYLQLVFEMRNRAYENFKPALSNVLQGLDTGISTSQITGTFLDMYMSDQIYLSFQDELKESGKELGIANLAILDSNALRDRNLTDTQQVADFISNIKSAPELKERRGVAVIEDTVKFNPGVSNSQGDYWIIGSGSVINISITIENQGNVIENDVNVAMKYMTEDNVIDEKKYTIPTINPSEKKVVEISGFDAYPGRKCEIVITAGPVPDEVFLGNNTASFKFMMD
jgi:hypothetical protein